MAYQTGVASTLQDLIGGVINFAQLNGFTVGPSGTYTGVGISGVNLTFDVQSLVQDDIYFLFAIPRTGVQYLWLQTAESWNGTTWSGQSATWTRCDDLIGPNIGHHFFCDGRCFNAVVEVVTNVFTHFNFGTIQKNGNWVGGQFVTGLSRYRPNATNPYDDIFSPYNRLTFGSATIGSSRSNSGITYCDGHIRTPVGAPTASFGRTNTSTVAYCTAWADNSGRNLVLNSPNSFNGRSVLVPINIVQAASGQATPFLQLGYVGNACVINIRDLNPKDIVNTDWMVFPVTQKNGNGTIYINSKNYGYAYRK